MDFTLVLQFVCTVRCSAPPTIWKCPSNSIQSIPHSITVFNSISPDNKKLTAVSCKHRVDVCPNFNDTFHIDIYAHGYTMRMLMAFPCACAW